MEYTLKVHSKGKEIVHKAEEGINVLKFLRNNNYAVNATCGGKGTCGKCKIRAEGHINSPSEHEIKLLGDNALSKGYRLACFINTSCHMDIYLDEAREEANIATEGKRRDIEFDSIVKKIYVSLPTPDFNDQRPDLERIGELVKVEPGSIDIQLLQQLPVILRKENYKVTFVYLGDKLIGIEPGDTTDKMYGLAVDIGTTTIAAYLIDLTNGKEAGIFSCLNPQKKFGADVISRISYANGSEQRLDEMNSVLIASINDIINEITKNTGIKKEDIYTLVLAGNTTMMHFLMKISPEHIAVSPFIPATTELHILKADRLGLTVNKFGTAVIVPSVSAYIGADTIAAIISSGMYEDEKISLLVDIGTNGEIALGNRDWIYSCSVAAGPAFEGAHIRNGIGGIKGAIDSFNLKNGLEYTTIGGAKPIGICGSGILDLVSQMLDRGIIDETGRITDPDEMNLETERDFKNRIIEIEGITSFLISGSNDNIDIALTQKDIRELQNAKAAVAAGINILIKESGINAEDIDKVYLAGGFGSYMKIDSAVKIGLIPKKLEGKIESIGNAAGSGAVQILESCEVLEKISRIKKEIKYIELSSNKDFVDEYINSMIF